MKTYQACIPCINKLIESTLERSSIDAVTRQRLLESFKSDWAEADMTLPPARNAGEMYLKVLQDTCQEDIFQAHKQSSIEHALKLYPRLRKLVVNAVDPLDAAIRVSALGNIIDVANPNLYDLEDEIDRLMEYDIQGNSLEELRSRLAKADSILILADNAGETVFDKVLIESLDTPVFYAVKSGPAFDDALIQDAQKAGIDQIATLIETGTPYPGTFLPSCSGDFQELFQNAPLVLAKGQANFETLNDTPRDIFFLLKVKCEVVSDEIGYPVGSLTLQYRP